MKSYISFVRVCVVVLSALGLTMLSQAPAQAGSAPTKVSAVKVYWNPGPNDRGFMVGGKIGSPDAACRKAKRMVSIKNLSRAGFNVKTKRGWATAGTFWEHKSSWSGAMIKKGDRLRIKVLKTTARSSGGNKVVCRAKTIRHKVKKIRTF